MFSINYSMIRTNGRKRPIWPIFPPKCLASDLCPYPPSASPIGARLSRITYAAQLSRGSERSLLPNISEMVQGLVWGQSSGILRVAATRWQVLGKLNAVRCIRQKFSNVKATFVVGGQHPFGCIYHSTPRSVRMPPGAHTNLASWFPHASGFLVRARLPILPTSWCLHASIFLVCIRLLVFTRFHSPGVRTPPDSYASWCLHALVFACHASVLLVSAPLLVSVRPGLLLSHADFLLASVHLLFSTRLPMFTRRLAIAHLLAFARLLL